VIGFKRLIREIHQRSLWQLLVAYFAAAWVVLQFADTLTAVLGLPDWVPQIAFVLCVMGLPLLVATAIVQKGGPFKRRPAAEAVSGWRGWLTWRHSFALVLMAIGAVAAAVTGYTSMRALGIGPVGTLLSTGFLDEDPVIVLADVADHTRDSLNALAVDQLFIDGLSQSTAFELASRGRIAQRLRSMGREPGDRFDEQTAREVAIREGLKAVIAGDVNVAGDAYIVSARIIAAETGDWLWTGREDADSANEIIPATDRLTKRLRERIGESLKSIRRSMPLMMLTTSSLDALKKFTEGVYADYDRALALWEEAVTIDPGFATAHGLLGARYYNSGDGAHAITHFTMAFEHRDRLLDGERYMTEGRYHQIVTGDLEAAAHAYRNLLELTPGQPNALGMLGQVYALSGDYAASAEQMRQLIEVSPGNPWGYRNLANRLVSLGEFDEARATIEAARELFPQSSSIASRSVALSSAVGDYDAAEAEIRSWRAGGGREFPTATGNSSAWLALLAQVRGRIDEAERHWREAMLTAERDEGPHIYVQHALRQARRVPLDSMEPLNRPYLELAEHYALAGEPERARAVLAEYESEVAPESRGAQAGQLSGLNGLVSMAEGRPLEAIDDLRQWPGGVGRPRASMLHQGRAYDLAGAADSAIALYERYVEAPDMYRLYLDADYLAHAYWRLGNLYEDQGDTERAVLYYARLIELWESADPELQPRVEAARRSIRALSPDR
jgi:tetratricopeptide (TPR) repeat protein